MERKKDAKLTGFSDSSTQSSDASSGATYKSAFSTRTKKSSKESLSPVTKSTMEQEHARYGYKSEVVCTDRPSGSLTGSITNFRDEFDQLTCKMKIFGESLNLCKCISNDFQIRLQDMENRLEKLERRQRKTQAGSNYLEIIQKNKQLSHRTRLDAKKLQMCGTEEEMREVAARLCRNYLHGTWKTIEPSQLEFRRISGGLSNFLYYVALKDEPSKRHPQGEQSPQPLGEHSPQPPDGHSPQPLDEPSPQPLGGSSPERSPESGAPLRRMARCTSLSITEEPRKVLLRIYGQVHGERAMDAIVTESVIFTLLSERRLGPKLHGVFSGGRIEEYIPARPLLTKELAEPALSMKIAEKMAAIHSMDIPLSKEPNWLWKTMGKWLKTVTSERLSSSYTAKNQEEEKIIKRLKNIDFEKEIEWLKKFIATIDCPVVFCHNDLQEGNILMLEDHVQNSPDDDINYVHSFDTSFKVKPNKEKYTDHLHLEDTNTTDSISSHLSDSGEPKLVLIDFEYCAYNYRGFDLANHFQEWCYDYTNPDHPCYFENQENAPSLEQKEIFIREYLKHYQASLGDGAEALPPTIDEINELLNEVEAFALASHLFWCLWSVVNASKSQIPFGYWEYAISRLDTYLRLKQEVIKKDKFGLPLKRKICEVDI